jgi:hypothetical protein
VPHGHAGLRFTITLYNSDTQIEDMLTCLSEQALVMRTEIEIDLTADVPIPRKPSAS